MLTRINAYSQKLEDPEVYLTPGDIFHGARLAFPIDGGPGPNTKIGYVYRVPESNKRFRYSAIVAGRITLLQIATISKACENYDKFIPGQIGLMDLQAVTKDIHFNETPFHEISKITFTSDEPNNHQNIQQIVSRFQGIQWNNAYRPPYKAAS